MTDTPRHYACVDGTVWPVNVGDIAWRLRYGTPSRTDLLIAASVLSAYRRLTASTVTEADAFAGLKRARRGQRDTPLGEAG